MTKALTQPEREWLLALARCTLIRCTGGVPRDLGPAPSEGANRRCGAFVSLHKSGRLRGCIGTFREDMALAKVVASMAEAAALHDTRFQPLRLAEVGQVDIEISALTPMEAVADPEEIEVGRDGLYITGFGRSGVLLPQVAVEYGMDKWEFLAATCEKAGLPVDAWKRGAQIQRFGAEVFGEASGERGK